jgi:antimicrobial peptide system SdpA family protein
LVYSVLPQGWAFFTRNPRESQVLLYRIKNNNIYRLNQRHSSFDNVCGLKRNCTKLFSEVQLIQTKIPDSIYSSIQFNYLYMNDKEFNIDNMGLNKIDLKNDFKFPILKGEYLLVFQEIIPWAWLSNSKHLRMNSKAVILNVK